MGLDRCPLTWAISPTTGAFCVSGWAVQKIKKFSKIKPNFIKELDKIKGEYTTFYVFMIFMIIIYLI